MRKTQSGKGYRPDSATAKRNGAGLFFIAEQDMRQKSN
jgi:hypothetical protein